MRNLGLHRSLFIGILIVIGTTFSCKKPVDKIENMVPEAKIEVKEKLPYNIDNPKSLVLAAAEACGGMDKLKSLKDVSFDYHYVAPDGKKDVSNERYIFENEASWAKYSTHEINFPPVLEGSIVQFYDGKNAKVYNNGKPVEDPALVGTGQFLRQANYMWFTMMFKLSDPGIIYKYLGQEAVESTTFDKVHVTYDPEVTGKAENDIFILYINPQTRMVESFNFSLPAFGVAEPVLHAQLTYTEIDGLMVITKRIMTGPSPDGKEMVLMADQQSKNVQFNNGFTTAALGQDI